MEIGNIFVLSALICTKNRYYSTNYEAQGTPFRFLECKGMTWKTAPRSKDLESPYHYLQSNCIKGKTPTTTAKSLEKENMLIWSNSTISPSCEIPKYVWILQERVPVSRFRGLTLWVCEAQIFSERLPQCTLHNVIYHVGESCEGEAMFVIACVIC